MANDAIEFAGVTFERYVAAWGAIGEVTSFRVGGSAAPIDVTHVGSSFKEKLMGLPDEGQWTFDCNCVPGDTGQAGLRADRAARTRRQYRITLTDTGATVMSFYGYCIGYEVAGGNDEKVALSVTIEIDGEITWT